LNDRILVDTDILIDAGRGDVAAIDFLEKTEKEAVLSISVITVMELFVGCKNKREQKTVERFTKRFERLPLTEIISLTALQLLKRYRLSHGLLIADALIAATAKVHYIPLVSKNQKDYRYIEDLKLLHYPPEQ